MNFLDKTFYNNSIQQWIVAIGVTLLIFLLLKLFKAIITRRLEAFARRTKTEIDDWLHRILDQVKLSFLIALAVYAGSHLMVLPERTTKIITIAVILMFLIQVAIWGNSIISYWIDRYKKRKMEEDASSATAIGAIGFIVKLLLWSIVFLLALDNIGIDITGLVAGLGIGGIAVALALQNILGDLFASLSIVLDKPFVIGDFIIVDNYLGSVEHVGLKTTRVRSLSGEQLVFANSDLLNSRIRNYKRMFERRVVFMIGVVYQTPYMKLEKIPAVLKEIIEGHEQARFDRAHFKEFGNFSLNYEIVYYVKSPDYNIYMDIQQSINLEIFRYFEEEGIEFAFPTQTIFLSKESNGRDGLEVNSKSGITNDHSKIQ